MTQPDPNAPPAPAPTPAPAPPAPGPAPAPPAPPVPAVPAGDDKPLGPAGEKALREEREARKELERKLAGLAPLQRLADALGAGTPAADGRTEVDLLNERFAQHERDLATERSARLRLEVAAEKGLSPAQAARLTGATREEMAADADTLLLLFPTAPTGPRTPAPDPTQGQGGAPIDIDARIAQAQKDGDWPKFMSLQNEKLAALAAKQ